MFFSVKQKNTPKLKSSYKAAQSPCRQKFSLTLLGAAPKIFLQFLQKYLGFFLITLPINERVMRKKSIRGSCPHSANVEFGKAEHFPFMLINYLWTYFFICMYNMKYILLTIICQNVIINKKVSILTPL